MEIKNFELLSKIISLRFSLSFNSFFIFMIILKACSSLAVINGQTADEKRFENVGAFKIGKDELWRFRWATLSRD